jgi:nitrogen-specific signal transduction histidine kinase
VALLPLDLNRVVEQAAPMLAEMVSRQVVLHYRLAERLPHADGNARQVRQLILNLVLNASAALGAERGDVTVATRLVQADRAWLADAAVGQNLPEGTYVCLDVGGTGRPLDPGSLAAGVPGTLDLAALWAIVRGHHGAIKVRSEAGKATVFSVLLPAVCCP